MARGELHVISAHWLWHFREAWQPLEKPKESLAISVRLFFEFCWLTARWVPGLNSSVPLRKCSIKYQNQAHFSANKIRVKASAQPSFFLLDTSCWHFRYLSFLKYFKATLIVAIFVERTVSCLTAQCPVYVRAFSGRKPLVTGAVIYCTSEARRSWPEGWAGLWSSPALEDTVQTCGISNAVCFCSVEVLKAAYERCSTGEQGLHYCLNVIRVLQKQIYVQGVLEGVLLCLLLPADVYQAHQQWQVPQVLPADKVLAQCVPGAGLWLHGMTFGLNGLVFCTSCLPGCQLLQG